MKTVKLAFPRMPWQIYAQILENSYSWKRQLLLLMLLLGALQSSLAQYPKERFQAINAYFKGLEKFGLSGSLLIGSSQEIFFQHTYGNPAPTKGATPAYLIGSLTKQFTAAAILYLEQEGKLKTSDPISTYLDWVPRDKAQITIHQLMTHTSGLQDDYWDRHPKLSERTYLRMMLDRPLQSKPGSQFSYANIGYHVLCAIIESLTGEDYEAFLSKQLWKPAGMQSTGFHTVAWDSQRVARYTDWTTEGAAQYLANPLHRPSYLQPEGSGGLLSTTEDMYRWYQRLFHSDELLGDKMRAKLLQTNQENYAYGWEVYRGGNGRKVVEHGGYDSWVGVVTGFYYFVVEDIVVIYLGNTHMGKWLQKELLVSAVESLLFGGDIHYPPCYDTSKLESSPAPVLGIYQKGDAQIELGPGKQEQQIRLRTSDEAAIRQLLLPAESKLPLYGDVQLDFILSRFEAGGLDSLAEHLFYGASFEAVKQRYQQIWAQLEAGYGNFQDAKILHLMPGQYEGKFELEYLVKLQFEKGEFYVRAFRNHLGKFHLQPFEFPSKLEIFMVPVSDAEFEYWNIKTHLKSMISVADGQLLIHGDHKLVFHKAD